MNFRILLNLVADSIHFFKMFRCCWSNMVPHFFSRECRQWQSWYTQDDSRSEIVNYQATTLRSVTKQWVSFHLITKRCIKELNLCFQKLVSSELHTLYWGGFPNQGSNLMPWSTWVPGSNPSRGNIPNIKSAVHHSLASESRDSIC